MLPEDLAPLIQDVVDSHPGLAFLTRKCSDNSAHARRAD